MAAHQPTIQKQLYLTPTKITLLILSTLFLYPLVFVFVLSLKGNSLQNYSIILKNYDFFVFIVNSLIVSILGATMSVFVCLLAAYYIYKSKSKITKIIATIIMVSFLFPQEAKIIFNFLVIKHLNLLDNLLAVFLPFISNLFTLLLFVQAFRFYSSDIEDYCEIEGFSVLQRIILIQIPVLKNYCLTAFMTNFLNLWNDFLWPLMVIQSENKYTVQVGINYISKALIFEPGYFASALTISILIPIIIFVLFQKYFNTG
ncbi:MAG: ABC transporter permease subunit [bacterium]